jgi:hypothetical protein
VKREKVRKRGKIKKKNELLFQKLENETKKTRNLVGKKWVKWMGGQKKRVIERGFIDQICLSSVFIANVFF